VADLFDVLIQQFEIENIDGLNLIRIKESPLNHVYNRFLKRGVDLFGSLFIRLPLMAKFVVGKSSVSL